MADLGTGIDPLAAACRLYPVGIKPLLKLAPPQTRCNPHSVKTDKAIVECLTVGRVHPQLRPASWSAHLLA